MTATAQEISATNLNRRLGLTGPSDELTQLGAILDDLFARLEATFEAQRHFVANASHELRNPLAGQRTLLQVALADQKASAGDLRTACEEALQLGDQQEQLIDALLTLAANERGIEHWEPFDLAHISPKPCWQAASTMLINTASTSTPASPPRRQQAIRYWSPVSSRPHRQRVRHNTDGGHVTITHHRRGRHRYHHDQQHRPDSRPGRIQAPVRTLPADRSPACSPQRARIWPADRARHRRSPRSQTHRRPRADGGLKVEASFRNMASAQK